MVSHVKAKIKVHAGEGERYACDAFGVAVERMIRIDSDHGGVNALVIGVEIVDDGCAAVFELECDESELLSSMLVNVPTRWRLSKNRET
jgi:hypothetical protein